MTCPFCGGPMREGYILNPRRDMGTAWYPCDVTPPCPFSVKRTYERGGILLSDDKFFSGGDHLKADICFSCGKGVFSIKDKDKT